jgi:hypothetical protein
MFRTVQDEHGYFVVMQIEMDLLVSGVTLSPPVPGEENSQN